MSAAAEAAEVVKEIVAGSRHGVPTDYYATILERSRDESLGEEVREFLGVAGDTASFRFNSANGRKPYEAILWTAEGRTKAPGDLTVEDVTKLRKLSTVISDLGLKARILDVLWLCERKVEDAEAAVAAYLRFAEEHAASAGGAHSKECLERALRLAVLFRRNRPKLAQSVVDVLVGHVTEFGAGDGEEFEGWSISLLLEFGYGDPQSLYKVAREMAQSASASGNHWRASEYWKLAVRSARSAKDDGSAEAALAALAESYAQHATRFTDSALQAAEWIQKSIEAYRGVPGSKARREELYQELLTYQRASVSEMWTSQESVDITDVVKATMEAMEGKPVKTALFTLAFGLARPPDYAALERRALELARQFPLTSLFGATHVDSEGKVVAKSEGAVSNPGGIPESSVYSLASLEHQFIAKGTILPAVEVISVEHRVTEDQLLAIAVHNPFVQPGQERLYAAGLLAGFESNFVTATFILIPLIESSIRFVLGRAGVRVSTLKPAGIQEALHLPVLLAHERAVEIFGSDIVRDLKGLLLDRTYGNLRNKVSHGLVSLGTFYQHPVVYLWWLILRLILTPYFVDFRDSAGTLETYLGSDEDSSDE